MTNQVVKQDSADVLEQVIASGNLANLTPEQRTAYYMRICTSLGLNPLTRPFEYITLNGKLTLYARKDATDQLRAIKHISIGKPDVSFQDEWIIVTISARDATGREDSDLACVSKKDMRGDYGNAMMKAVTKAKRRVTLSICGLGMLDETEVETIPDVKMEPPVTVARKIEAPKPDPVKVARAEVERVLDEVEAELVAGPQLPIQVIPTAAQELLDYANGLTGGHYKNLYQVVNALKKQWPAFKPWPASDDTGTWAAYAAYLVQRTKTEAAA